MGQSLRAKEEAYSGSTLDLASVADWLSPKRKLALELTVAFAGHSEPSLILIRKQHIAEAHWTGTERDGELDRDLRAEADTREAAGLG